MALFDKVFGDEKENQLKQEIKSLELRRETVFTSINAEIANLENQKRELFYTVGLRLYNAWTKKDEDSVKLEEYWEKVQELEKQIVAQEDKRKEMATRYEEEISMIRNTIAMNAAPATPTATVELRCPKCNGVVKPSDVFCQSCGNKLQ